MMFLAVTMLLFGVSGQAMANFAQGDLIQVVYQTNGSYEVATDLGAFAPTTAYSGPNINFTSNPFPAAGAPGAFSSAGWSNLQISYFVSTSSAVWTSGPASGQSSATAQGTQSTNPVQDMLSKFASLGASGQAELLKSDTNSYFTNMDKGGSAAGSFGGFIPAGNGEQNLAALSGQSYVDSYLYYYATPGTGASGVQVADIRTFANGTSEVVGNSHGNPGSALPIPPSILLMGSGLMALCVLRSAFSAKECAEDFFNAVR